MYANILATASFWSRLVEIDEEIQRETIAKRCPDCGGPLHVGNYERKPRDVPEYVTEAFSLRFSTCCGHCRHRCTPQSVRFLGRRVYAGVVVVLAAMFAIVTGASRLTLQRWAGWWKETLPATRFWSVLQGRLVPTVDTARLPASLLERFEPKSDEQTQQGLIKMLEVLKPLTTVTGMSTHLEGSRDGARLAQKLQMDTNNRALLPHLRAPPNTTVSHGA